MAFPYTLIGPGGQQYIVGQIPLIQQQLAPQMVTQVPIQVATQQLQQQQQQQVQLQQQQQSQQPQSQQKLPDYMSEEKLQEKGDADSAESLDMVGYSAGLV